MSPGSGESIFGDMLSGYFKCQCYANYLKQSHIRPQPLVILELLVSGDQWSLAYGSSDVDVTDADPRILCPGSSAWASDVTQSPGGLRVHFQCRILLISCSDIASESNARDVDAGGGDLQGDLRDHHSNHRASLRPFPNSNTLKRYLRAPLTTP
jgi:hypothetical protein